MPRERTFRSEAIILKRSDFGEADRLLTLYTRDFGKIRAIAKGARKPQSRKTGHVELFMRTQFLFAEGRDINIITQAEMVEAYRPLRDDLVRTTYASYALELLDRFTVEEEPQPPIYSLLTEALNWFSTTDDLMTAARFYELRLLTLTGFRPQLFQCVACRAPVQEQDQWFSNDLGGLLCPNCHMADGKAREITAVAVKVLRYLQTRDWDTVSVLTLQRPLQHDLERHLHYYIAHILERHLKSVEFLHRLRREAELFSPPE